MSKPRTYGRRHWPIAEDPTRCVEPVFSGLYSVGSLQCSRKRGHGPDGLYCKQHDPERIKAKRDEREEKWRAEWAKRDAAIAVREAAERKRDHAAATQPELLAACKAWVDDFNSELEIDWRPHIRRFVAAIKAAETEPTP